MSGSQVGRLSYYSRNYQTLGVPRQSRGFTQEKLSAAKGAFSKRDKALSSIAELNAKAESELIRSRADMAAFKLKTVQGQFVDKGYFDRELSKRAAIFRSDLEGLVRSKASHIVALVGGDVGKIPELIDRLLYEMETLLARYSEDKPIEVPVAMAMATTMGDDEDQQEIEDENDGEED